MVGEYARVGALLEFLVNHITFRFYKNCIRSEVAKLFAYLIPHCHLSKK